MDLDKQNRIPKISIVTVLYNNRVNFLNTLNSVKSQDYSNIEYIVIDGGSTDGTIDVIKQNESAISKWISEPDKGIYAAMNKGINLVTGDYIWFLNGGDMIYSNGTLKEIFSANQNADVYYGDTELVDDEGKSYGKRKLKTPPENLTWRSMIDGMVITHQSLIIKKETVTQYDLKFKHCADIDWTIKILKNSKSIVNTHKIISRFLLGGYSRKNTISSLFERIRILSKHFNIFYVLLNHIKLAFKFIIHIIK
ncbi:MAG: glycosyltransferase family 2 protein, partial [Ignavibacteriae bacterium]|nr:glycosyltransferase family 2 protein [Ignavibacteriota bacterium]